MHPLGSSFILVLVPYVTETDLVSYHSSLAIKIIGKVSHVKYGSIVSGSHFFYESRQTLCTTMTTHVPVD